MTDEQTTGTPTNEYEGLTLHGRTNDDGTVFTLYTLLNGVELPVQVYHVHDHRERFDEARSRATESSDTSPTQ